MKRWVWLALAGLGVCLLLALGHTETGRGVDSQPCLASWGRSVGAWGEPALASPTAALAKNRGPRQAGAALPEFLAIDWVPLTERGVGPSWLDSRGPPGNAPGTWVDRRAAGQTGSPGEGCALPHPAGTGHQAREGGFSTAFS
jgi:hypothetical protein